MYLNIASLSSWVFISSFNFSTLSLNYKALRLTLSLQRLSQAELTVDCSIPHSVHRIDFESLFLFWTFTEIFSVISRNRSTAQTAKLTIKSTSFLHQMLALCKHNCNSSTRVYTAQLDWCVLATCPLDRSLAGRLAYCTYILHKSRGWSTRTRMQTCPLEAWPGGQLAYCTCSTVHCIKVVVSLMSLQFTHCQKNSGILNVHKLDRNAQLPSSLGAGP